MERVILNKNFQKKLFEKLLQEFSREEISRKLGINSSSIYHMKNGKINSIESDKINKIAKMLNLSKNNFEKYIIQIITEKDIQKGLEVGRKLRKKQLNTWKKEIPKLKEIIDRNKCTINVEKWLAAYVNLINFGVRKNFKINKTENKISIEYETHSKGSRKRFSVNIPRKIKINNDFVYFFGMWCGDRAGGGRIGVVNKQPELNLTTELYLKKMYQTPKYLMLMSSNLQHIPETKFRIDEVIKVKNMAGNYVIVVCAINGILKSFFDYLNENLDYLLSMLPNKNVFFAGLFDAEGNISLEDRCFRWACHDTRLVKLYEKHLKKIGLFNRFDGGNLISYNKEVFSNLILPWLKHPEKINKTKILCSGKGTLDNRFKKILVCINDNPLKTANELARIMNKKKVYSQIKFLYDYGYIERRDYPMIFYLTDKGTKEISEVVL